MRTPHSSTNKGKRVKVTFRDGTTVIGKFKDKKSGTIILEYLTITYQTPYGTIHLNNNNGDMRIKMKDVRAFSIYKPL